MAGSLIVPPRFERNSGFSPGEVNNLISGLERMTDEQLAQVLAVALGEVHDRHGPQKCLDTVSLLLNRLEAAA